MCYFVHSISSPENMKPMFHEAENDLKKGVPKTHDAPDLFGKNGPLLA